MAAGASRAQSLSAATHARWLLAVICGALVAAVGFTTSARARATARSAAVTDDAA